MTCDRCETIHPQRESIELYVGGVLKTRSMWCRNCLLELGLLATTPMKSDAPFGAAATRRTEMFARINTWQQQEIQNAIIS